MTATEEESFVNIVQEEKVRGNCNSFMFTFVFLADDHIPGVWLQ